MIAINNMEIRNAEVRAISPDTTNIRPLIEPGGRWSTRATNIWPLTEPGRWSPPRREHSALSILTVNIEKEGALGEAPYVDSRSTGCTSSVWNLALLAGGISLEVEPDCRRDCPRRDIMRSAKS
jgi:hypothetical protein